MASTVAGGGGHWAEHMVDLLLLCGQYSQLRKSAAPYRYSHGQNEQKKGQIMFSELRRSRSGSSSKNGNTEGS